MAERSTIRRLENPAARASHDDAPSGVASGVDSGRAWAVAAAAFFASAVALGVIYSFGVFLQPIAADLRAGTAFVSGFEKSVISTCVVRSTSFAGVTAAR